jgi:hypothetical protein
MKNKCEWVRERVSLLSQKSLNLPRMPQTPSRIESFQSIPLPYHAHERAVSSSIDILLGSVLLGSVLL